MKKTFVALCGIILLSLFIGCPIATTPNVPAIFTVTFNSLGGSAVGNISNIASGATVTLPAAPTKSGYSFAGWYTSVNGGGTQFTASTAVTANITVYANWTANTYTVTFNSQGGSAVGSISNIANGATVTLPAAPTLSGYTFAGWYTSVNGGGTQFTASTAVTANITVYANWTANTYTVTFNSQGGSAVGSISNIASGATVALPAAPTKSGYTFAGWYTSVNGGGTQFTASTAVTANITVYANWTANTYTVTFNSQGGSAVASISNIASGATITLPAAPTLSGYTFAGWYTLVNGGGTQFTASTAVTANITVYANWTANTYTVTFNSQGGSAVGSISNIASGATVALPAAPTKSGYTFAGWYTSVNGGGTQFTASTAVTANITVYANWTANTYTVTFNSQGGSAVASISNIASGATVTLPAAPTLSGYTFAGWYTAVNGGGTQFTASTAVTANITVYANWTANTYTVTFNSQGGSAVGSISNIASGATITLPAAPTLSGYTFAGWYTAVNGGGTQFTASTAVTANMTVYANWTANTYTVTFNSQGGSAVGSISNIASGATVTLPAAPTLSGYTFAGWYTAVNGGGTQFTASTAVTANITVYANWLSQDASLSSAVLTDAQNNTYSFTPTFVSTTTTYTISPALQQTDSNANTLIPYTLTLTTTNLNATITSVQETGIGGPWTDSHIGSVYTLTLAVYQVQVVVTVTAQDGISTQTYSISLHASWRG